MIVSFQYSSLKAGPIQNQVNVYIVCEPTAFASPQLFSSKFLPYRNPDQLRYLFAQADLQDKGARVLIVAPNIRVTKIGIAEEIAAYFQEASSVYTGRSLSGDLERRLREEIGEISLEWNKTNHVRFTPSGARKLVYHDYIASSLRARTG